MPDHPCHIQGRGLLATGHSLVPTSCQELPPQGTAVPPRLLWMSAPQPMSWSRSCDQHKEGYPTASGHSIQGIFPRPLLTCWEQVCYALWTTLVSHNLQISRYLVPKVPLLNPSHLPGLYHNLELVAEISESHLALANGDTAAEIRAQMFDQ